MALDYSYQWQRGPSFEGPFKNIPRARGKNYTATSADEGLFVRRGDTAVNVDEKSAATVYSLPVGPIARASSGGSTEPLPTPTFLPSVARVRDRIAYGGPADEAEITSVGVQAYVERQLRVDGLSDSEARRYASYPTGFDITDYVIADDLGPQSIDVARMVGRKDALRSAMHEFWINHLVPGYRIRNTMRIASLTSLKEAFYHQGLGNFTFLLKRYIMSTPLQYFMDNYLNVYGNVNENLGREVLELFALGINEVDEPVRYDQVTDVAELTRLLTGHGVRTLKVTEAGQLIDNDWRHRRGAATDYKNVLVKNADGSFDHNQNSQTAWFYPDKHDPGDVSFTFFPGVVFSNAIDGKGVEGYDMHPGLSRFCSMLVKHRPAARFMCTKIAKWFLGCPPTVATREKMMDKWIEAADAPDQIAQVLRVLFYSEDFCSDFATGKRALTPIAWYSKLLNCFGENFFAKRNVSIIKGYCEKEEYITHTYQTPAGFPDDVDYWLSPGHLTERNYRGMNILPNNANNNSDFCADYTSWCIQRGFKTPRELLNFVQSYWFSNRATPAQMAELISIFGSTIDSPVDWTVQTNRERVRDTMRTVIAVDLSHFAA